MISREPKPSAGAGTGTDSNAEATGAGIRSELWRFVTRSPITDPRSVWASVLAHAALAGLVALMPLPTGSESPEPREAALIAELAEPIDNAIPPENPNPGGAPEDFGGFESVPVELKTTFGAEATNAATEDLLRDVLSSAGPTERLDAPAPAPSAAGVGLIEGAGAGGGGGIGGGTGGGRGTGVGPGTEFFGTREVASSFVYIIDCSGSMARNNALEVAKAELLASLNRLPAETRFETLFYNLDTTAFKNGLAAATDANKNELRRHLATIEPFGGTDHVNALKRGLELGAEVVFFLTDADMMTQRQANELLEKVGSTRIHAIEFGVGPDITRNNPLKTLATATGGTYKYIDTNTFRRARR